MVRRRWRNQRRNDRASENWRQAVVMFFVDSNTYEGIVKFLSNLIH